MFWQKVEEVLGPVIVGERTNVMGSRKFKQLIMEEKLEEAAEIGQAQVRNGAQMLDVCMAHPDRNELLDMEQFVSILNRKVKVPLMIDSTDHKVIEAALIQCQGKCMINSINLENGKDRFRQIVPLLQKYGGAVIVGCIDEDPVQGMAITRQRKLDIAKRSYDLLTNTYGIPPRDIIFDSLVFPVGTGDANYVGSALETIEGLRLIKQALPPTKTILGISNVSFGLPATSREILNAVFLYHCIKAGLDYAILNTEQMRQHGSIPKEERGLSEDLIFSGDRNSLTAFLKYFEKDKNLRL